MQVLDPRPTDQPAAVAHKGAHNILCTGNDMAPEVVAAVAAVLV